MIILLTLYFKANARTIVNKEELKGRKKVGIEAIKALKDIFIYNLYILPSLPALIANITTILLT